MKCALAVAFLSLGLVAPSVAVDRDDEVAAKQRRLRVVVAELSSRDVSKLAKEKREARARAIALLADYAERGQFTIHHEAWPRTLPLFVDENGTRCALASVLDGFGEDDVVLALAKRCNDAYLAEIADDPEVVRVVDELGLTLDEAAYIQDPGNRGHGGPVQFDGRWRPTDGSASQEAERQAREAREAARRAEIRETAQRIGRITGGGGDAAPRNGPMTGGAKSPSTTSGTTETPHESNRPTTVGRHMNETSGSLRWTDWWESNRDDFVSLRACYHDRAATLDPPYVVRGVRLDRPSATEIRDQLLPLFLKVAHDEPTLRSTALAMAGRDVEAATAPRVVEAMLAFMADPAQPDREWGPVMLAIVGDATARAPLAELVRDSDAGRRLYARTSALPEETRALAAIAYGRCGGSIDLLQRTLADEPAAHPDLAAACVVALGLAARDATQRVGVITTLLKELEKPTLPTAALAQLPGALLLTRDSAVLPALFDVVARFRGPRELRRSCALVLGRIAPDLDEPTVDALAALARRDVDGDCRHAAILALGLVAARHGSTASDAAIAKLVVFHQDALDGRFRHVADLPWHALSAALFVRGRPDHASDLRERLRNAAGDDGDEGLRAAALLGLGLARDEGAAPLLLEAVDHGSDFTASFAAESLGLVGARGAREPLLEICRTDPSSTVGWSAASALGCLADPTLVEPLVATFERTPSAETRAALARALGEIGDRRAIDGLRRMALDEKRDGPSRERAIAALGVIGQARDEAWNEPMKEAIDPGAATPSLRRILELF